jgi:hypothetical protein
MLQDAIDVGQDLRELGEVIGRAVSDTYRILKVAILTIPTLKKSGSFAVKLWRMSAGVVMP